MKTHTPQQRKLAAVTPEDLARHEFPAGSMGPNVEAVTRFATRTGGRAAIGSLAGIAGIVAGDAGTNIATRTGSGVAAAPVVGGGWHRRGLDTPDVRATGGSGPWFGIEEWAFACGQRGQRSLPADVVGAHAWSGHPSGWPRLRRRTAGMTMVERAEHSRIAR